MRYINKYLRNLAPYSVASHVIWEVSDSEKVEILKLDWNEATINPSPQVRENLLKLAESNNFFNLYPSTYNEELHSLIASYCGLPLDFIQYFSSSDSLHEYLVRMYVSVGDPILILGPTYDNFRLTCESQGGRIIHYEYSTNFEFDEESFKKAIDSSTPALIYICNPNNPTGNTISNKFMEELLRKYDNSVFIVDEAYFEFYGTSSQELVESYQNLFISRTFSKAFALANFRAGYLISHPDNIRQVSKIRNPKNLSTFSQAAVISVLRDIDYMKAYVIEVKEAREIFKHQLSKLSYVDKVFNGEGNFILVRFKSHNEKMKVFNELAENKIFVRNLTHREILKDCLRVTIGTKAQMSRVMKILLQIS